LAVVGGLTRIAGNRLTIAPGFVGGVAVAQADLGPVLTTLGH
jgi:hypothetical protein